jgi:hypothetical protein
VDPYADPDLTDATCTDETDAEGVTTTTCTFPVVWDYTDCSADYCDKTEADECSRPIEQGEAYRVSLGIDPDTESTSECSCTVHFEFSDGERSEDIILDTSHTHEALGEWDIHRWMVVLIAGECEGTEGEYNLEPVCVLRITSSTDDLYDGDYTFHEWSFKTKECTDIRKCKGEGDWILPGDVTPTAHRAYFLRDAALYYQTAEDCRCLLWFKNDLGEDLGAVDGNEIVTKDGEDSYLIPAGMAHYWMHCQVNYEHQLQWYTYDNELPPLL